MTPPVPIIVLSPIRSFTPIVPWSYYNIAGEFPNDPIKTWMLWLNYPWMFAPPLSGPPAQQFP